MNPVTAKRLISGLSSCTPIQMPPAPAPAERTTKHDIKTTISVKLGHHAPHENVDIVVSASLYKGLEQAGKEKMA